MIDNKFLEELIEYNKYRKYCFKNGITFIENKDFERALKARYNKVSRLRQHFIWLFLRKKNTYFITFTFDDKHLKLCDRSRKDLIKNSLKDFDEDLYYIINVDYGKKNERLHYHAIIGTDCNLDIKTFLQLRYPCIVWCEKIILNQDTFKSLPKYINKLSNHAIKSTTRNSRILYNFKGYGSYPNNIDFRSILDYEKFLVGLS